MKREPWLTTGQPYWKGIYSASQPKGKMKSTASMKPLTTCSDTATPAPNITVDSTTTTVALTLRLSGVEIDSNDAAQLLQDTLAVAMQQQWITNAFRPLVKSIRVLSVLPDEDTTTGSRRLKASGDLLVKAAMDVNTGKASDAAQYCIKTLSALESDVQGQGEYTAWGVAAACHRP